MGYGGSRINKTVTVKTNDPAHRETMLFLEGEVDTCATINPRVVRFTGPANQKMVQKVAILPNSKYPFKIKGTRQEPLNADKFKHSLEKSPMGWTLTVENLWHSRGGYYGSIYLDTDSPVCKSLRVEVQGDLLAPMGK
jgi:hypothetical protein